MQDDPDLPIRLAAFRALGQLTRAHGPVLAWRVIAEGFEHGGRRFRFANVPKGIFRPHGMETALSIKTTIARDPGRQKYTDLTGDTAFGYAFEARGADSHDNRLLLAAFERAAPIIYFFGVEPRWYRPLFPAWVESADRTEGRFRIVVDADARLPGPELGSADARGTAITRLYTTVTAKRRLHQEVFSHLVVRAYDHRCAMCGLPRLLDGAHIVPDRDERGLPEVPNGLALCKLHHGAFDANLIGIRPDRVIEVSQALLEEHDGPTLEHALKGMDGRPLRPPRDSADLPAREYLSIRYEEFKKAG